MFLSIFPSLTKFLGVSAQTLALGFKGGLQVDVTFLSVPAVVRSSCIDELFHPVKRAVSG